MIHILIGTRAQLIKMIPLMDFMYKNKIEYNFIFMAQHKETIYEILSDFNLPLPNYVLCDEGGDIVRTSQMIKWSFKVIWNGILNRKKIFQDDKSGIVLIHGDAPPLLLGAIIAKTQRLKVGSVEAGLRSFNFFKPFPEELIRVVTGKTGLIDVFYCQDDVSLKNSQQYKGRKVHTHGNTIFNTIELAQDINIPKSNNACSSFAVISIHRFETIANAIGINSVVKLVKKVASTVKVKFILHPPTRAALIKNNLYQELEAEDNIELLPRMNFIKFNQLISKAQFLVSDGGSNQEETAFLGIPCLIFRNETERQDGLGSNAVLSKFNDTVIDDFLINYHMYRRPVRNIKSDTTKIIIQDVIDNYS